MAGNRWTWSTLLVVLLMTASAIAFPTAAQSSASAEPLTWTLSPTPDETPEEAPEETLTETPEETPRETLEDETTLDEETPVATLDEETPRETPDEEMTPDEETTRETLNETTNETALETINETGPPVVIGTDEATPAETSTADLPTFTPIQAAQVDGSATQAAPLSLAGVILAVAVAGLLVVIGRNRK